MPRSKGRQPASPDTDTGGVKWAALNEVEDFATELPEEFLLCREMGHRWLPYQASRNHDGTYHRALRCPRCKTKKEQEISGRGVILSTQYKHPEGYLHAGMGRIAGDGRGVLRIESLRRTIIRGEDRKR